jgi:hypothetical protein
MVDVQARAYRAVEVSASRQVARAVLEAARDVGLFPSITGELTDADVEAVMQRMLERIEARPEQEVDLHAAPNLDDVGEAAVHRAITTVQGAIGAEYADDELMPNLTVVASVPPDGRVGIASTEPDAGSILYALEMGWGAVHKAVRLRAERQ